MNERRFYEGPPAEDARRSAPAALRNREPIVTQRGIHRTPPQDMYFKGALFIHTLRSLVGDDARWWKLLRELYQRFKYSDIATEDVVSFFNRKLGRDLTPVFDQYLRHADLHVVGKVDLSFCDYSPATCDIEMWVRGATISTAAAPAVADCNPQLALTSFDMVLLHESIDVAGIDTGNLVTINLLSGTQFSVDSDGLPVGGLLFGGAVDLMVGQTVEVERKSNPTGTPPAMDLARQTRSGCRS